VLDDEFLIALDIQQILEVAGARYVECTSSVTEALGILRRDPKFDLGVLDVKLGSDHESSLTVATLLAERRTPFIFLTGMRDGGLHTQQFPYVPVLEKPYQAEAVIETVRRALEPR
jgi:DNA-binding NtrC family response regulator